MRWQNFTESGSPPCFPQVPNLMPGREVQPFSTASFIADLVEGGERVLLEDIVFQVGVAQAYRSVTISVQAVEISQRGRAH